MNTLIQVKMGDMHAAHNPTTLQTTGIGSCIVIILYDPIAKVGAMAHAMLPAAPAEPVSSPLRYVPNAIDAMLQELTAMGAHRDRLLAKLIGGAHMFSMYGTGRRGIGAENIASARKKLADENIPIAAEELGGSVGRTASIDLVSGVCSVETKM